MIERCRDEIAQDAAFSIAEFRKGKLKAQTWDAPNQNIISGSTTQVNYTF
ncbi:MAG: hypothetical protein QNJ34_14180 [Xenococcaceae cyanobacterium MO_188.B29]|nr:hypothetical protein [Xenococcaceae cyanobacterium MO_188.B29]